MDLSRWSRALIRFLSVGILVQLTLATFSLSAPKPEVEASSVKGVATTAPTPVPAHLPIYTVKNGQVYADSSLITIRGINWFGFDTNDHVAHGLWVRNWEDMLVHMQEFGFNAVRLPVCGTSLHGVTVNAIDYRFNPDLQGLQSDQILDHLAQGLADHNLYFVIDFHSFDCGTYDPLWYTPTHPESEWIDDLTNLANRYASNPYFLGIDLKNEPHDAATWGTGNVSTDWNLAAERAGKAVLAANPRILTFVQGVHENPVCVSAKGNWWGGTIEPERCTPISTDAIPADKLVLSPHIYGPSLAPQPYYSDPRFPNNLPTIWAMQFGRLVKNGLTVVPGEWGALYQTKEDQQTLDTLVNFFISTHMCSNFYWAWNPNSHDIGGVLLDDWETIDTAKQAFLQKLWSECNPA
jgi:endoglucanase